MADDDDEAKACSHRVGVSYSNEARPASRTHGPLWPTLRKPPSGDHETGASSMAHGMQEDVFMMPILSSPVDRQVVVMTTFGVTSDN